MQSKKAFFIVSIRQKEKQNTMLQLCSLYYEQYKYVTHGLTSNYSYIVMLFLLLSVLIFNTFIHMQWLIIIEPQEVL